MSPGRHVVFEEGSARAVIDLDNGARLASLTLWGLELLVTEADSPLDWGCYPMAPFAGRVRRGRFTYEGRDVELPVNLPPHAIHGTVFDAAWDDEGDGVFSTPLVSPWPFPGRVVQRVKLRPDALELTLEVHAADEAMPASCGWHPWFRRQLGRGRSVELVFDALYMYQRDLDGIPDGEKVAPPPGPWDDCFTDLLDPPRLRWPGAATLTVESSCPDLVVFDEPPHAVCVEPQTGPPDALNLGPSIVVPGQPLVAEMALRWSPA